MTELSFLIELLLEHDLKVETKKAVAARIKEVEGALQPVRIPYVQPVAQPLGVPPQAPSTLALMAKHGDLSMPIVQSAPVMPPIPAVIAQTPQTAAALNARNEAIASSLGSGAFTGKPEKGRTSPRKF
jgi:hypothetical protein